MPYVDVIDPKCLISIFFGKSFRKTIVIFAISSLKWVYLQNFTKKKKKNLNSGPDMPDLGILGVKLENNIVILEIRTIKFI